MTAIRFISPSKRWLKLATILVATFLSTSRTSWAGLTLTSSTASSFYSVATTGPGGPNAVFNPANNELLAPGGGLPALGALTGTQQFQSVTPPPGTPLLFTTNSTTNPASQVGFVPTTFGTATTQIYTATSGQEGGFTTQGGLFWSTRTSIADNLGGVTNAASISFSTASATYTNKNALGTQPIMVTPGAILNVMGTLGAGAGSYVAAGLYTTYSLNGGSANVLDQVVLAGNNSGVRIATTGGKLNEFGAAIVAGNSFLGLGTSSNGAQVAVGAGQSITINGYLTLYSDPGSTLNLASGFPPFFPNDPSFIPDFGVFADAPEVVPEPASVVLLGAGLALASVWVRSRRAVR
jgi:hypothetical protein